MGLLLLALAFASAVLTFNIYRPNSNGIRRAALSFVAGIAADEMAPWVIAAQAVLALALVAAGALSSPWAWIAVPVLLASWIFQVLAFRRALSARASLAEGASNRCRRARIAGVTPSATARCGRSPGCRKASSASPGSATDASAAWICSWTCTDRARAVIPCRSCCRFTAAAGWSEVGAIKLGR